jgi:hypothetical protein
MSKPGTFSAIAVSFAFAMCDSIAVVFLLRVMKIMVDESADWALQNEIKSLQSLRRAENCPPPKSSTSEQNCS